MVRAGVSIDGRTDLYVLDRGTMTAQRYRDKVLDPIVRPYAGAVSEAFIVMHDNAPSTHCSDNYVSMWISKILRLWIGH